MKKFIVFFIAVIVILTFAFNIKNVVKLLPLDLTSQTLILLYLNQSEFNSINQYLNATDLNRLTLQLLVNREITAFKIINGEHHKISISANDTNFLLGLFDEIDITSFMASKPEKNWYYYSGQEYINEHPEVIVHVFYVSLTETNAQLCDFEKHDLTKHGTCIHHLFDNWYVSKEWVVMNDE